MTIIVFLVDTSASMNQRAYLGGRPSILDVAKNAVETFVKVRQRSQESRGDRYMLLTFEEPPNNIKAGWKENLSTFMNELKNLQCLGLTSMGSALKHTFDVLNLNRMQTGIDTYGQGRCPFFLEPSVILVITDGGKLSSLNGVTDDFNLPMHTPIPGSELTREPFRWDQRLFALVLRLSGTPANERDIGLVPSDNSPIDAMCEVTGGRSYCITSHRMMMQCIDSLVQKVQSGVVINFEKIGPDPSINNSGANVGGNNSNDNRAETDPVNNIGSSFSSDTNNGSIYKTSVTDDEDHASSTSNKIDDGRQFLPSASSKSSYSLLVNNINLSGGTTMTTNWQSCRKMILVPRSAQKGFAVGFWPLPESFWPDINISVLPPRSAHPNVKFTCTNQDPMVIENLPFDKYELEPSPLTQYILARKQPTMCWQVFVPNSYKNSEVGHPFGYLKASTNLTCVNLFVMPYNYPVLLPLLEELFKGLRLKPTPEWTQQFRNYMRTMPSYYAGSLRRALIRMGASNSLAQTLIPDSCDTTLSLSVLNYLKKMKNQAKIEFDRLCNDVLTKQNAQSKNQVNNQASSSRVRVLPRAGLKRDLATHPNSQDKFMSLREQLNEYGGFVVGLPASKPNINTKSYRNPFDIHRSNLLDQVVRMRANFLQPMNRMKLVDDDVTHSLPVNQMGNYQEYLKRMPPPLREIESVPVRQHMFGNPFKIDKRMMVDEADIDLVGGSTANTSGNSNSSSGSSSSASSKMIKRLASNDFKQLPTKRKPGPIPREVIVRRPSSPSPTHTPFSTASSAVTTSVVTKSTTSSTNTLDVLTTLTNSNDDKECIDSYKEELTSQSTLSPIAVSPVVDVPNQQRSADIDELSTEQINLMLMKTTEPYQPASTDYHPYNSYTLNDHQYNIDLSQTSLNTTSSSTYPIISTRSQNHVQNFTNIPNPINETVIGGASSVTGNNINNTVTNKMKNGHPPLNTSSSNNNRDNKNNNIQQEPSNFSSRSAQLDAETSRHNISVRHMLFADVRKPGKNYQQLLDHLMLLKGEFHVQETIIKQVLHESLRFKRANLAKAINNFLLINRLEIVNNIAL